jgi:hypothetical protein
MIFIGRAMLQHITQVQTGIRKIISRILALHVPAQVPIERVDQYNDDLRIRKAVHSLYQDLPRFLTLSSDYVVVANQ